MSNYIKLLIAGAFFLAAAFKIQAHDHHHLECWHCSSDTMGAESFCGTTFQEDNIPTDLIKERNISLLRKCNSTINSEHERPVCRKTVEEYDGKTVTKRFCYYTNKSDNLIHCNVSSTEKNVRRIFCEDCLEDKCNAATQMAAIVGGIFVFIVLLNIVAF